MTAHNTYILMLSIGPVQPFIQAARRSRDLHMGSLLLSEVSKAVAAHLADTQKNKLSAVNLIFPAQSNVSKGLLEVQKPTEMPTKLNVANRIVAQVHASEVQLSELVEKLHESARDRLKQYERVAVEHVEKRFKQHEEQQGLSTQSPAGGASPSAHKYLLTKEMDAQIKDALEFNAVWVPFSPETDSVHEAIVRGEGLLRARKASATFAQPAKRSFVQKSSLDGRNDSVLQRVRIAHKQHDIGARTHIRVGPAEALDALGFIKRMGGEDYLNTWRRRENDNDGDELPLLFVALSRLALDPWIAGIEASQELQELKRLCEKNQKLLRPIMSQIKEPKDWGDRNSTESHRFDAFPFDGEILLEGQLQAMIRQFPKNASGNEQKLIDLLKGKVSELVKKLHSKHGVPWPYVAVLAADGDKIGDSLRELRDIEQLQVFSAALSDFADEARRIVEQKQGSLVYAGGDDVLAFLPVDTSVECAQQLAKAFQKAMEKGLPERVNMGKALPTLSVGLAWGHCLNPLGDLRRAAKEMEAHSKAFKSAHSVDSLGLKKEKNALSIKLMPRSGAPIIFRQSWKQMPLEQLSKLQSYYLNGQLPARAAFEVKAVHQEFSQLFRSFGPSGVDEAQVDALPVEALWLEVERRLERKRGQKGAEAIEEDIVQWLTTFRLQLEERRGDAQLTQFEGKKLALEDCQTLANMMLVARMLARSSKQRNPAGINGGGEQ